MRGFKVFCTHSKILSVPRKMFSVREKTYDVYFRNFDVRGPLLFAKILLTCNKIKLK